MFPKLKPVNCVVAFLSSAFQAFGMYNIHALSCVTEGGVFGLTLLLHHWLGISPATILQNTQSMVFLLFHCLNPRDGRVLYPAAPR